MPTMEGWQKAMKNELCHVHVNDDETKALATLTDNYGACVVVEMYKKQDRATAKLGNRRCATGTRPDITATVQDAKRHRQLCRRREATYDAGRRVERRTAAPPPAALTRRDRDALLTAMASPVSGVRGGGFRCAASAVSEKTASAIMFFKVLMVSPPRCHSIGQQRSCQLEPPAPTRPRRRHPAGSTMAAGRRGDLPRLPQASELQWN